MADTDLSLRPMDAADADAVHDLGMRALFSPSPDADEATLRAWMTGRFRHLVATDPGGAWVLERAGTVAGVAVAIVREHVWGLSMFALDEDLRGRGHGRTLLDAALGYGAASGAEGWIVLSSENPAAMRLYAHHARLDLHPTVACAGIPDLSRAPQAAGRVADAGAAGVTLADAIGREVRGAGHGPDIEAALGLGCRLLVFEERAFALARQGNVTLLAARDEEAAALVLWGSFLTAPRGSTAIVTFLTGAQQWAIRVCLEAGLPLSVDSPVMTRGRLGPMTPYIPSGSYL